MSESKLRELSIDFSVDIIELVKHLKSMKESIISNQIGRSGTSIGANIHEAQYAQGKKYFIIITSKIPRTSAQDVMCSPNIFQTVHLLE